MFEQINN